MKKKLIVCLVFLLLASLTGCASADYAKASGALEAGEYAAAAYLFEELGEYKDSAALAVQCEYLLAKEQYENGELSAALDKLESLKDYKDSTDLAKDCRYLLGKRQLEGGELAAAEESLKALGDYKDCADLLKECRYLAAKDLLEEEELAAASESLKALGDYKDCAELLADIEDEQTAQILIGKWETAFIDETEMFMASIRENLAEDGEALMKHFAKPLILSRYFIRFTENGTMIMSMDAEAYQAALELIKGNLSKAVLAYFDEELRKEAAASGLAYADLLSYYGVSSTEELLPFVFGCTAEEFVESILAPLNEIGDLKECGAYRVADGEILLYEGEECSKGTYDAEKGELTLTGEGVPEDEKAMYPMVFTRSK